MTSNEKYNPVLAHMDKLSDPALKINLDCIRPGLVKRDANNDIYMVPVFSRTYGTLVNNDLFKKEGVSVPKTWSELLTVCDALVEKGYKSPMMGYTLKSSSCLMNTIAYPSFVAELAKNPTALQQANDLDPAAGEYMRGSLEKVQQLINSSAIDLTECDAIQDNYDKVLLRFLDGDVPADRIYSPEELGVKDPLAIQIRVAAYKVGRGELTIDEAVAQYGTFKA